MPVKIAPSAVNGTKAHNIRVDPRIVPIATHTIMMAGARRKG
jgi:hypothetical protein